MTRYLPMALTTIVLAATLTGCGGARAPFAAPAPSGAVRAANEGADR